MSEKIVGYILLIVGTLVIFASAFSAYEVFTKKTEPIQLFNFSGISINMANLLGSGDGLTAEQQAALERQKASIKPQEIVSASMINDTSNFAAHLFLMGFLVTVGYKVASLGVNLLRPIVVKAKEEKQVTPSLK